MKRRNKNESIKALAASVSYLMGLNGHSGETLGSKAGIAPKTTNNIKNAKHNATLDKADAIADVYEVETWQLLIPGLPVDLIASKKLAELIAIYASLDQTNRKLMEDLAVAMVRPTTDIGPLIDGDPDPAPNPGGSKSKHVGWRAARIALNPSEKAN